MERNFRKPSGGWIKHLIIDGEDVVAVDMDTKKMRMLGAYDTEQAIAWLDNDHAKQQAKAQPTPPPQQRRKRKKLTK